jgi:hypothetical protein
MVRHPHLTLTGRTHLQTGSSAHGHDKDFGHATWSVGSRELRQPGTEADE